MHAVRQASKCFGNTCRCELALKATRSKSDGPGVMVGDLGGVRTLAEMGEVRHSMAIKVRNANTNLNDVSIPGHHKDSGGEGLGGRGSPRAGAGLVIEV